MQKLTSIQGYQSQGNRLEVRGKMIVSSINGALEVLIGAMTHNSENPAIDNASQKVREIQKQ